MTEIAAAVFGGSFADGRSTILLAFLDEVHYPLAVRSSSLLEDSQYQPIHRRVRNIHAGAIDHSDIEVRLEQLMEAIKRVYASTFSQHAKAYVRATPYRLEEEKMAVMLQQVVGAPMAQRFYPDFSGRCAFAQLLSRGAHDGRVTASPPSHWAWDAPWLGAGNALTFCPRYPQHLVQFSSVEDVLANSQTEFWALKMGDKALSRRLDDSHGLREASFGIEHRRERDGTLHCWLRPIRSTTMRVYDGLSRPGRRIVSFAPILKHGRFPLPQILDQLMNIGEYALGRPVEIEFAVRVPQAERRSGRLRFPAVAASGPFA